MDRTSPTLAGVSPAAIFASILAWICRSSGRSAAAGGVAAAAPGARRAAGGAAWAAAGDAARAPWLAGAGSGDAPRTQGTLW